MAYPRRHLNATILPTGQVLVTGGTSGTEFTDESRAVHPAELWDPATGSWTTLASNSVIRVIPRDCAVASGWTGAAHGKRRRRRDHRPAERGDLLSALSLQGTASDPSRARQGSADTRSLSSSVPRNPVRSAGDLVRLGSVTHAFDSNQRFNGLTFVQTAGGLNVTAPANANLAPPGHYLLFIVNQNGVPSTGKSFRLK